MSPQIHNLPTALAAPVFAALGDENRLSVLTRLSAGRPQSISQLTRGTGLTRQAMTKHLHVLADAGIVCSARHGRELRFELNVLRLAAMAEFLTQMSQQWDEALSRLAAFVETSSW